MACSRVASPLCFLFVLTRYPLGRLSFFFNLLEPLFRLAQRLLGTQKVAWLFVAPNLAVFGVFTFLPIYAALAWGGIVSSRLATAPVGELVFQALYQGGGTVVVAGVCFNLMVRYFDPVRTTMLTSVVPGLSALGAVIFLDEPLYLNLILGLALVTTGILIGARKA